jgi:hypothetical protein
MTKICLVLLFVASTFAQWVLLDPLAPALQSTNSDAHPAAQIDAPVWCVGKDTIYVLSTNGMWKYEIANKRWFWQPDPPKAVMPGPQWSVNDILYIYVDGAMWTYDTVDRHWELLPSTGPSPGGGPHWRHLSANRLYMLNSTTLWAFDLHLNQWSIVPTSNAPTTDTQFTSATQTESFAYLYTGDKLWQLDMATFVWSIAPVIDATSPPGPNRNGYNLWALEGGTDILLFGGSAGSKLFEDTWSYSIVDKKWTFKGNTGPSAREAAGSCINSEGYLIIYSGDTWKYGPFTARNVFELIEWKLDSATLAATIAAAGVFFLLFLVLCLCVYLCVLKCRQQKNAKKGPVFMQPSDDL